MILQSGDHFGTKKAWSLIYFLNCMPILIFSPVQIIMGHPLFTMDGWLLGGVKCNIRGLNFVTGIYDVPFRIQGRKKRTISYQTYWRLSSFTELKVRLVQPGQSKIELRNKCHGFRVFVTWIKRCSSFKHVVANLYVDSESASENHFHCQSIL